MTDTTGLGWPIWFAIINAALFTAAGTFIFFYHYKKSEDLEQSVDYSFSHSVLATILVYYRSLAIPMIVFYFLFVASLWFIQRNIAAPLFAEGRATLPSLLTFAFDLVARGAFFDFMEHFDIWLTPHRMNYDLFWFVVYAFTFRMFYALTLLRLILSFAWIWGKIRLTREQILDRSGKAE